MAGSVTRQENLPTVDTRKPITKALGAVQGLKSRSTSANNHNYSEEVNAGFVVESGALPKVSRQLVD